MSKFIHILVVLLLFLPSLAQAVVLVEDAVWEGEILLNEDVLVPEGITLTVRKNTLVTVQPTDSTKIDPEYMSSLVEITVRGTLLVEGNPAAPVIFELDTKEIENKSWAGIIVDGGNVRLRSCTIRDAETAVWIVAGKLSLLGSTLTANRYGLVVQGEQGGVQVTDSRISGNEYGLVTGPGVTVSRQRTVVKGNRKKDLFTLVTADVKFQPQLSEPVSAGVIKFREYEDEVLTGDVVWEGHIRVNGRVRVTEGSRLIILPGTIVEFSKKDTNGDTIGENGLMLQGVLVAKGTAEKPIVFRSAELKPGKGDWDGINIINSDGALNIIEYSRIEDAYRGLHFHFANVTVRHSGFRHNYRGVQFQESTVALQNNTFYRNTSAVQARDSEIIFTANQIQDNVFGANFLRAHLTISRNTFGSNLDFGLKIREGYPTLTGNVFHHNRFGLMFSDMSYGRIAGNLMLQNSESGLSVRSGSNMEITGNFIQGNGLSGISVRDSMAVIRGNHISKNGERGIGVVSFNGPISDNTLVDNQLYAIAAEDGGDVSAPMNWFGQADIDQVIYDRKDDPGRGRVQYMPVAASPPTFEWPLAAVPLDLDWSGIITVPQTVNVPAGITLKISPGTSVLFAGEAGMQIGGGLQALGTEEKRIRFSSAGGKNPESWGEIVLQNALDSRIVNSDFEYALWGIHSHFTNLTVSGCSFRNGYGGIRFRSGPLTVANSLFADNSIGIRAFRGKAVFTHNQITRNKKGIFVREQGGGLLITQNNIFDNEDYNIWVGDFNTEDIPAPENWWGMDNPVETFFDARREPGIGTVLFDPVLAAPLDILIVDKEQF